jgi:hypothetical protein
MAYYHRVKLGAGAGSTPARTLTALPPIPDSRHSLPAPPLKTKHHHLSPDPAAPFIGALPARPGKIACPGLINAPNQNRGFGGVTAIHPRFGVTDQGGACGSCRIRGQHSWPIPRHSFEPPANHRGMSGPVIFLRDQISRRPRKREARRRAR